LALGQTKKKRKPPVEKGTVRTQKKSFREGLGRVLGKKGKKRGKWWQRSLVKKSNIGKRYPKAKLTWPRVKQKPPCQQ